MTIITYHQRYYPHELSTRFNACKLYATKKYPVAYIIRKYKISKASLMRWMQRYDGTKDSLRERSHRPLSSHPKAHTESEIQTIRHLIRRTPSISLMELFGKLKRNYHYTRCCTSLFRVLRKLGFYLPADEKKTKYTPKPYDTPIQIGVKIQVDVKHVPKECCSYDLDTKFYQYTAIDEASRERFIYAYPEVSTYSTVDFIKRMIHYFGYQPQIIQTDNGSEFTHNSNTKRVHPLDALCATLGIQHQLIRPRTPRHNGKVERSHRNDNRRFYQFLKFYSLEDLQLQMKRYLKRSNNIPMQVLGYRTPREHRAYLEEIYGLPLAVVRKK